MANLQHAKLFDLFFRYFLLALLCKFFFSYTFTTLKRMHMIYLGLFTVGKINYGIVCNDSFLFQILSTCFICHQEEWNLPTSSCCNQNFHEKCVKRWKRTLVGSANACPQCRHPYPPPTSRVERRSLRAFMRYLINFVSHQLRFQTFVYKSWSTLLLREQCRN